jgi:hypothetical protein
MSVFLSYSHGDSSSALVIASTLASNGVQVWIDNADVRSSHSLPSRLLQLIEQSEFVLILHSANYLASKWCRFELETTVALSVSKSKPSIIVCRLDDTELPASLASRVWRDARKSATDCALAVLSDISQTGQLRLQSAKTIKVLNSAGRLARIGIELAKDTDKYTGFDDQHEVADVVQEAEQLRTQLTEQAQGVLMNFFPINEGIFDEDGVIFPNGHISSKITDTCGPWTGSTARRIKVSVDMVGAFIEQRLNRLLDLSKELPVSGAVLGYVIDEKQPIDPKIVYNRLQQAQTIKAFSPKNGACFGVGDHKVVWLLATPSYLSIAIRSELGKFYGSFDWSAQINDVLSNYVA